MIKVENLYSAFSNVPRPTQIPGCRAGCCLTEGEVGTLLRKNLHELSDGLLSTYLWHAFHLDKDDCDFKYFIPRILDLKLQGTKSKDEGICVNLDTHIIGVRLGTSNFTNWSSVQFKSVDDLIFEIVTTLASYGDYSEIGDWLCAISFTDMDKVRYLDLIDSLPEMTIKHIFSCSWKHIRREGRVRGPYWDDVPIETSKLVLDWLIAKESEHTFFKASRPNRNRARGKAGRKRGLR
ncbi:hypothetical protein GCM10011309_15750 [Litorimonas cladophorae]|uniref:Uncharacterized protein n=1 Tax=Litorimonas cladophorae TaxID=1220491 RepID=A0A918KMW1_9PROT|nr:hypothetical protein [Litorimonas cladophorae]GGX66975.1 hypothetical protein GCM10011309_15750 [Litorimonas cladophorae]